VLVLLQLAGMALFILGVQGGVRVVMDSSDTGLMSWLPGGLAVQLLADFVLVVIGAALARYAVQRRLE
jgi:hypothetical protein